MNLDLHVQLNKAAKKIRKDIVDHVVRGQQLNGKQYTPNKESTLKRKPLKRRLVARERRFATSRNYKIKSATKSNQTATLSFSNDEDAEIALYNQTPTGRGSIAKEDATVFWGISEKAEKEILKDLDIQINKTVDKEIESWGFKKV